MRRALPAAVSFASMRGGSPGRMKPLLAAALGASLATAAFASPDDAPPRVELPLGPYVRANRPLDVRVIGGADRVRAPGTPWALPVGARGDEFLLQMPAAVVAPLDLTVERAGRTDRVTVAVAVLPGDERIVALLRDARAPNGAVGVPVTDFDTAFVEDAWLLFDYVVDGALPPTATPRRIPNGGWRLFAPLVHAPDALPFAALEEAEATTPLVDARTATILVLLAATELTLVVVLASRRDRAWAPAAWIAAPAVLAAFAVGQGPSSPAFVATPLEVESGRTRAVYVRVHALRDGTITLRLPEGAWQRTCAVLRFAADDRSVEDATAGAEVRLSLRAGESRVVAYPVSYEDWPFRLRLPGSSQDLDAVGPAISAWLGSHDARPLFARTGVDRPMVPEGDGVRVLPGLRVSVEVPPTK